MKIVTVSLDIIWENKESNFKQIQQLMLEVSQVCPDLVVFPEMTLTGFTMNAEAMSENLTQSSTIAFFSKLAVQYKTAVAFGVILKTNKKPTNNLVVVSSKGNLLGRYEKIHPFSHSGEMDYYSKGEETMCLGLKGFTIGLTICYDLRFPELYQSLSKKCDVIINIANWPSQRVADWILLLHARALENQCFIIGVNRTGVDGMGLDYVKSSIVIGPTGKDIEASSMNDIIDIFEIEKDFVDCYRNFFPVKKDRRVSLYKKIL